MIGPQQTLGVRPGDHTTTTSTVMVCSLDSASIRLDCNGASYTITPTAVGTDSPAAGKTAALFRSTFTVTGLSSLTRYPFTVTQNGVTRSDCSLSTAAKAGDRYSVLFATCDRHSEAVNCDPNGMYSWIRERVNDSTKPKVVSMVHCDDVVYANDTLVDDSAGTGHTVAAKAETTLTEYSYALPYSSQMGLLQDRTKQSIRHGRAVDRVWTFGNVNVLPQWGDHEFNDSVGWERIGGIASSHATFTPGKNIWNAIYGQLHPTVLSANSNAWIKNYGDVLIIAPDRQTNATGTGTGVRWGNTQIDDILAAVGSFTGKAIIVAMPNGWRHFSLVGADEEHAYGSQEPLALEASTEAARFMTAATTGLMARINASGQQMCFVSGDYHLGAANLHKNTGGVVAESFYEFCTGTATGANNRALDTNIIMGTTYQGATKLWIPRRVNPLSTTQPYFNDSWVAEATFYGDLSTFEWEVKLVDITGNSPTRARWRNGTNGNLPIIGGGARKMAA